MPQGYASGTIIQSSLSILVCCRHVQWTRALSTLGFVSLSLCLFVSLCLSLVWLYDLSRDGYETSHFSYTPIRDGE